jgi:tRNA 2-thiouridine synthesizing protein A
MRHLAHVMPEQDESQLDLRGLKCPLPALRTRSALARLAPGATLVVGCTDPLAGIDIPHLLRETGDVLEEQGREGAVITFRIRKAGVTPSKTAG